MKGDFSLEWIVVLNPSLGRIVSPFPMPLGKSILFPFSFGWIKSLIDLKSEIIIGTNWFSLFLNNPNAVPFLSL